MPTSPVVYLRDRKPPLSSGDRSRSTRGYDAGPLLLRLSLLPLLVIGALALYHRVTHPPPPATHTPLERLSQVDLVSAADNLAREARLLERDLSAALLRGGEDSLLELMELQAEAAQLDLRSVRFAPLPRQTLLVPVAATIQVRGGYYDLPIFIDSQYRQRRAVRIERITVQARGPLSTQVEALVEARFYRPAEVPLEYLTETLPADSLGPGDRAFAAAALGNAARIATREAFQKAVPHLMEEMAANRRQVLRIFPTLVRQLAGSPLDWVAAEFHDGEVRLLTEPEDRNR